MSLRKITQNQRWHVYTDGAIRPELGISGLAAIVRDEQSQIRYWWQQRAGKMTCNEAEYAAVFFALEQMLKILGQQQLSEITVYSDSRVVVDQMSGRAAAHAPGLRQAQTRLQSLVARFDKVSFQHIPREQNRLADALAFEAVTGGAQAEPRHTREPIVLDPISAYFQEWSAK